MSSVDVSDSISCINNGLLDIHQAKLNVFMRSTFSDYLSFEYKSSRNVNYSAYLCIFNRNFLVFKLGLIL